MANRLDIILFGATGFTGIHCIPYIAKHAKENGRNLSWGVAGRNEEKLKAALKEVGEKLEASFDKIPIIIASVNDYDSLVNMGKRTKLVINCCGPYRFYGDVVVKACIEAGAHHLDVSGEPEYMERVQLEQHDAALEKGVYAISACGFDSIPVDLGIVFLQENFEGTLNSVETYLQTWSEGESSGPSLNYGTWESAVQSVANESELRNIRKLYNEKVKRTPTFPPKVPQKLVPHKPKVGSGWALPFLGSDKSVARRTQGFFYENDNVRPVQVATYFVLPSMLYVIAVMIFGVIFKLFLSFEYGRKLLLDYPAFFTVGFFSKQSPSEEKVQSTWFSIDFYGEGWKEKLTDKDDQYSKPVDRCIKAQVKGRNPAYGSTCLAVVMAAIVLLTETDKMANKGKGGIYPPGAAFAKTSLIKQLNENEVTFKILSQEDIKN
ncbi:unnamed protein product [Ceutorhynchus assimilis]|uniref:Saccharopine dehydrogenase NADP binding domain-containing protein n=1 Tax=Ceutorhynchus assimilis TaxID=467358 RepID=A0A9N9MVY8_9CUCU|nr:unnamed protein product [Ceutorhynchus assimilis]